MTTKIYATQGYMVDVRSRRAGHQFVDQLAAFGDTELKRFLSEHFTVAQLQEGCELKAKGIEVEFVNEPEPVQVEAVAEVIEEEDDNLPEADVEWTASNGQRIQVWTGNRPWLYTVAVDGKFSHDKKIEAVPVKFADAARKNGVVAMVGRVGLTAERKATLQAIDRSGARCYPVG